MLQTIRDRAQGWIAWVIVILITIPFALWGVQSYVGVGGEPIAATINGVEITQRDLDRRVQQTRIELRERLGPAYDAAVFDDNRLRVEVMDDMIREALLLDVSRRLGLRVSDREIRMRILSEPAFQRDGRFDRDAYERMLQLQGLTPPMFEAQLQQQMTGTQLIRAVAGSEFATRSEVSGYQRLEGQKRELVYARLPLDDFKSEAPIDDAAIEAYYAANPARFQSLEQVKLDYLVLDATALAPKTEVSDEQIRQAYEADQARFGQPERRQVRHLLRSVPSDADEADAKAVLAEIEGVRERLVNGELFDALAKTLSKDPGSATEGGSLGTIEPGIMVPAFDQVAFSLPAGEISEPVRTRFGYHLIKVDDIIPARIKPLEEVRDELRAELAKQGADMLFYDMGERLANLAYESPDSLEPAADELDLTILHGDWINRTDGGEGILAQPKVIAAAFSDEVLVAGNNSDLIEPEPELLQAIVLRVVDHREASTKPLAEVRDEIVAELKKENARSAAALAADSAAEKLRQGAEWAAVFETITPEEPGLVGRQAPEVPAAILDVAFKLPIPSEGGSSVGTAVLDDGDMAVVRVNRVQDGETEAAEGGKTSPEATLLSQGMGRQVYTDMLKDMESRADIERRPISTDEAF